MLPDDLTQNLSIAACPVPTEQLPLNEYEDLKESWFFRWATLDLFPYIKPTIVLWGLNWLVSGPVAAISFAPAKHPTQFGLLAAAGASIIPALALLRLYLGWRYVKTRLLNTTVFYEESGWYDGQTWVKPTEVLARDRLVVSYQIQPILNQIQGTFAVLAGILGIGAMVWRFLN